MIQNCWQRGSRVTNELNSKLLTNINTVANKKILSEFMPTLCPKAVTLRKEKSMKCRLHGAQLGFLTNASSESGQVIGSLWISWHCVCDLVIILSRLLELKRNQTDWQRNVYGNAKLMIETLLYNGIRSLSRGGRLIPIELFHFTNRLIAHDPCAKKTT